MNNTPSIEETIKTLQKVVSDIKSSDFSQVLEQNYTGQMERAKDNISNAIDNLESLSTAESRQS